MFYCLISRFLDQESIWSADQKTGVYIYRRKRVSVLMALINATQGVVFPRKRFFLGISFRKNGAWLFFLGGGGGTFLKCAGTTKLSVFCLISRYLDQESIWSADQITGVYIYRRKRVSVSFCRSLHFIPLSI